MTVDPERLGDLFAPPPASPERARPTLGRPSRLFVPPRVSRDLAEETRRREAEAFKVLAVERGLRWVHEFDQELERIEHGLRLIYCPDPAPLDAVGSGAKPGRWHVMRPPTTGPVNFIPLEYPDGTFREPGSWVFEMLQSEDLWDDRVISERNKRQRRLEAAKAKREEDEREEFNRETFERWKAVSETSVSMNRSVPWSQNVKGRKRG